MKKESPWTALEVETALEMAGLYIGKSRNLRSNVGISSSHALARALNKIMKMEAKENADERTDKASGLVQSAGEPPKDPDQKLGTARGGGTVANLRDAKPINGKRH